MEIILKVLVMSLPVLVKKGKTKTKIKQKDIIAL